MTTPTTTTSLEDAFELLAEAADCRYPLPDRENRGLCPAHGDRFNPGLVFRISEDHDKILVHCFSRECSMNDIAVAIGLRPRDFFASSGRRPGQLAPRPRWRYLPFVELVKLLPVTRHFDTEVEATFNVLETLDVSGLDLDAPLRKLPKTTLEAAIWGYLSSEFNPDEHDWYTIRDTAMGWLRRFDLQERVNEITGR